MVLEDVLEKVDSKDLAVFAVWMPVLRPDSADEGRAAESLLPDPRVSHYWDADSNLGKLYGSRIDLPRGRKLAWDIYLVFAPGVRWEDELPTPTAWMHQLGRDERRLDGDKLRNTILEALSLAP